MGKFESANIPGGAAGDKSMLRLILLGGLAAMFFSSTFILNRAMSLEGGHWVYSASLRYAWTIVLLCLWLVLSRRTALARETFTEYSRHWMFWTLAGGIGCGLFYAPLCLSAQYAPGWVAASTWQITILASPLVLALFGKRTPLKGVFFSLLIFAGIVCVNAGQALSAPAGDKGLVWSLGVAPVVLAAFAYPFGNQLVWEARHGSCRWLPRIDSPALENSLSAVLLLALGSLPFWLILGITVWPGPPSSGQILNTGLVALFSGVVATSLFLYARRLAVSAYQLVAVDATQAGETIFSLAGEVLLLGGALPGALGWLGVGLATCGLLLYVTRRGQ